ncbi:MAG TPA: rhomboid family intramembrane serine protease [Candidatus Paceibacterota bacterium]|nr:rhomboid family intramembrane serine protease [Candidatus Paceibacterota bacterium]
MIGDRDYMRQPAYQEPRLSLTVLLIIINAACFLLELIISSSPHGQVFIDDKLALSLEGIKHGYLWQFVTFQFLHAGWMHIIFNCLGLYFFGRTVETMLGRSRFLGLYLTSGILGGVTQMLFALAIPQYFDAPVVGASAGVYGLVAAFAYLSWHEYFTVVIYFFPVTMRGRTLFWGILALAGFGLLLVNTGIANAAHLGGILTGFFYARQITRGGWPNWSFPARRQPPREIAGRIQEKKFWRANATPPPEELSAEEYLQKEVDPILDKISEHGIQSLTAREKQILEKARAKMARR